MAQTAAVPGKLHRPADQGAGQHCESGARTLFHARAFDWLGRVLNGTAHTEPAEPARGPASR
jgi:hypothetical protein